MKRVKMAKTEKTEQMAPASVLPVPALLMLAPALLVPTPDNARTLNKKGAKYQELLASVKAEGVRVPVAARPHPTLPGKYDLRYGEQRREAALDAGHALIPVLVYEGISDAEAYDLTFTENCHRDDLNAIETGRAVMTALEKNGNDVKATAARFGRSVEWIRNIARLRNLIPTWQEAVEREERLAAFTMAHLLVIAEFPADVQMEIHKDRDRLTHDSVKDLTRSLNDRYRHALASAPFNAADVTLLPSVGACSACPKRASQVGKLWKDDDDAVSPRADVCLSPSCWDVKRLAAHKRKLAEAERELGKKLPVVVNDTYWSGNNEAQLKRSMGRDVDTIHWDATLVPKAETGAVPVFVVEGKGEGKVQWLKKKPGYGGESGRGGRATGQPKPLKERRASLQKRRDALTLNMLVEKVKKIERVDSLPGDATVVNVVLSLVGAFGIAPVPLNPKRLYEHDSWKMFDELLGADGLIDALWLQVRNRLTSSISNLNNPSYAMPEAKRIAGVCCIDLDALKAAAAEELPDPKSWAALNEDGTPKKAEKESAKLLVVCSAAMCDAEHKCSNRIGCEHGWPHEPEGNCNGPRRTCYDYRCADLPKVAKEDVRCTDSVEPSDTAKGANE